MKHSEIMKYTKKPVAIMMVAVLVILIMMISATAQTYLMGDANLDGKVRASDARFILRVCADLEMFDSEEAYACSDITGDGMITAADARLTLRLSAELEPQSTITFPDTTTMALTTEAVSIMPAQPVTDVPLTISYEDPYAAGRPAIPEATYTVTPDTFVIVTYGYGHGVGMSSYGAMGMDHRGYNYLSILAHYYTGIAFESETPPATIRTEKGEYIDTYTFVCRSLMSELGGAGDFPEALKAQAVAIYSVLKFYNYRLPNSNTVAYSKSFESCTQEVKNAVASVFGQYMTYDGKCILACYGAMSAGRTADESEIWGVDYPYLEPVDSFDDIEVNSFYKYTSFVSVRTFTSAEMKERILNYRSDINLSSNPSEWILITRHDGCISDDIGYVNEMNLGDYHISFNAGQIFRCNVCGYKLRSHCFYIIYYDIYGNPHLCF